jgi:hypothetical protein
MRAIKLHTHVDKDHILRVRLPEDIEEGPAEVIVLIPDTSSYRSHSLADVLSTLSQQSRRVRTKEEIDRDLESERESWSS